MAESVKGTRLTAAETGTLWTQYMNDSMASCVLKHMLEKAGDTGIRPIINFALKLSDTHLTIISGIFNKDNVPVPVAFTENDVNVSAPRLFSDVFALHYIQQWSIIGLSAYGLGLGLSARVDVREFYNECLKEAAELNNRVVNTLLSKGVYIRAPYIAPSKEVSFAKKQSFLGHIFGEQSRPLSSIEIGQLYSNIQTNTMVKALMLGFGQTAQSEQVRKFTVRLKEIAKDHIKIFSSFLLKEDLNPPITWDTEVMNSIEAPFSDKLIMFHTEFLIAAGIANYGASLATSARKDLALAYSRLIPEVALLAEDGSNILIDKHWFEEPPLSPDREVLAENRPH